ncbi:MAG: carboxylesterase family protein [Polyangiales bacterium]
MLCLCAAMLGCAETSSDADDSALSTGATPAAQEATAPVGATPSPAAPAAGTRPIASGLIVETDEGAVRGKEAGTTRAFLGIPFAQPPTGALRWRPPVAAAKRSAQFDARNYGSICPQELPVLGLDGRSNEDCLRVNVWAPRTAPAAKLPVMVYIHGGSFNMGSGGDQYDGQKLASAGTTVMVTINYRLGPLGFAAHEKLTAESGTSGNYAIMDQAAALAWVRRNISAFGGDPDNVTIFGESAGGNSVCALLVAPSASGLFHKAIVQSGLCMKPMVGRRDAEAGGVRLQKDLGCETASDPLACMRAVPARTVLEKVRQSAPNVGGAFYVDYAKEYFMQPIADGVVVPGAIAQLLFEGKFARVPLLHGATSDEGILFQSGLVSASPIQNEAQFRTAVNVRFPNGADKIVPRYAPPKSRNWNEALARATGDAFFVCAARRMSKALHQHAVPSYIYRFTAGIDSLIALDLTGRAIHGADIIYTFGNPFPLGTVPASQRAVTTALPSYWQQFAKTGDPNNGTLARWEPYDPAGKSEFRLGVPLAMQPEAAAECDLWDELAAADAPPAL